MYFSGAPPRVTGFTEASPNARPFDLISHFSTRDQPPGLQPRRPSNTGHSEVYSSGAPPRVTGFTGASPNSRPFDFISHLSTQDQPPGLQPRRPSNVQGLGLFLPQHQEYSRLSASSSQPLDLKQPTDSHSPVLDQPVPNPRAAISDMCVHRNHHSLIPLIFQQALHGTAQSLGESRTWK